MSKASRKSRQDKSASRPAPKPTAPPDWAGASDAFDELRPEELAARFGTIKEPLKTPHPPGTLSIAMIVKIDMLARMFCRLNGVKKTGLASVKKTTRANKNNQAHIAPRVFSQDRWVLVSNWGVVMNYLAPRLEVARQDTDGTCNAANPVRWITTRA